MQEDADKTANYGQTKKGRNLHRMQKASQEKKAMDVAMCITGHRKRLLSRAVFRILSLFDCDSVKP
jgi:hypothetical protein